MAGDVRALGLLLNSGTNYSFSFINTAFIKSINAGGVGSTSSSKTAGATGGTLMSTFNAHRALYTSALPLLSVVLLTVTLVVLTALITVVVAILQHVVRSYLSSSQKLVTRADAAASGLLPAKESHTIPFSRALQGAPARFKGRLRFLVGRSYSLIAQEHVYKELSLEAVLHSLGIKPAHLAFAEQDGAFADDNRGLIYVAPIFFEGPAAFASKVARLKAEGTGARVPKRRETAGYKRVLRAWHTAAQ